MILLVHMLFGAAIGSVIKNVPLAIVLAFLGHYLLDLLPHIEYDIKNKEKKQWLGIPLSIFKIVSDFLLGILLVLIFSNPSASSGYTVVYICAFFAILPDGFTVLNHFFPNKILGWHRKLHTEKIHFLKIHPVKYGEAVISVEPKLFDREIKTKAPNKLGARPSTKNLIFSALVSTPFRILTQATVVIISVILLQI